MAPGQPKGLIDMPGMRYRGSFDVETKKKTSTFTNGEKAGMALALALLLFGIADRDVPLCFFTGSFLVYELHVVAKKSRGNQDWFLSKMLKSMSIAMFFGSIAMVFI